MSVPIRLNKVLKELNISLDRAVEFLSSKKINIEPRPTSKIDESTYRLLLDEFQTDKSDKDELEKINMMLVLGEKEKKDNLISIRRRFEGNTGTIGIDELKLELVNEIKNRSLSHRKETATTT